MATNEIVEVIPKEFLQGWIEGIRARLEAERRADSRKLPKNTNPIVTVSTAATISYYNGAEHILNELENLLNTYKFTET